MPPMQIDYTKPRNNSVDDSVTKELYDKKFVKSINGKNCFIVPFSSHQEIDGIELSKALNKEKGIISETDRITLLYEGFPPITKITISPMSDQERVVQQYKIKCRKTFWLRDVEVVGSKIPYVTTLAR